jgi:hypothetical protein
METIVSFFVAPSGHLLARLGNGAVRRASDWERHNLQAIPVSRTIH